jgi:uncharacterized protein YecT (DUF1311 family)
MDPCAASLNQDDLNACWLDQLKSADLSMNHLYRAALVLLEHDLGDARRHSDDRQLAYESTAILDLKSAQTAWMKYRDIHCQAAGQQFEGGSIQPIAVDQCLTLITQHRIEEIRAAYEIGGRKLE